MKLREYIELLQKLDQDMECKTEYDGTYYDANGPRIETDDDETFVLIG